ncbi:MAG: glycerol-3-phosphate dehydrogenase [Gaiellaceae bacterium]|jgi:glycerol-3-phosphate dehydrogenase|nr:glycerol-3-phosphate dehydrogenase [Gaiellaceae bacterium]
MDEPAVRDLSQLAERRFDVLVIGGGIIGAGIANEAARAGLSVALVDRGDFGAATSSASSKLIHGGLRYLRLGDVKLVREAHRERRALLQTVAPHLVRRLPFLFPLYRDGPYRPATMRLGLALYSTLARDGIGGLLPPARARQSVPDLRLEGLRSCGVYIDSFTHDGRLCLANVRATAAAGGVVANYAEVAALRHVAGRVRGAEVRDRVSGETLSVDARVVVNATGPWIDGVRALENPAAPPLARLSKGVHLLLKLDRPWSAALTIPHDAVRVTFAYPWQGMLLLGTTDTLYEGDPSEVGVEPADVARVLDEASVGVERDVLDPDRVRASFAGLRVLPGAGGGSSGETLTARRETQYVFGRGGMLTVAGGKLTTYRRIALAALERLRSELDGTQFDQSPLPLPGAAGLEDAGRRIAHRFPELDPATRSHLLHLYGSLAEEMLAPATREPSLLEPIHPDAPDVLAQIGYAREQEWAIRPEDVLWRRTTLGHRGLADAAAARVAEGLGYPAAIDVNIDEDGRTVGRL